MGCCCSKHTPPSPFNITIQIPDRNTPTNERQPERRFSLPAKAFLPKLFNQRDDSQEKRRREQEAECWQREMGRQRDEILEMMKRAIWTAVIENNWSIRLNKLRNANQSSKRLEYRCLRSNVSSSDIEEWKDTLKILQRVMTDESSSMTQMHDSTGKSFLLQIKKAVDLVAQNCEVLIRGLPSATSGSGELYQLAEKLNDACSKIPTLEELKRSYYEEMRNNSADDSK